MKARNLKVRPKREGLANPCQAEFVALLGCWASSGDMSGMGQCKAAAQSLQECMRLSAGKKPKARSTINYHLAKWSKHL